MFMRTQFEYNHVSRLSPTAPRYVSPVDCSMTPLIRFPPGSLVKYRLSTGRDACSRWRYPLASSSSRLVSGDVQSPNHMFLGDSVAWLRTLDSGAICAVSERGQLQMSW